MTKPAAWPSVAVWRSVSVGAVLLLASAVSASGQTVSFIARKDFPANGPSWFAARSVAVADFNGDGVADLAATTSNGRVSVLLGNGDGTFRLPQAFAAGRGPLSVVAADFNGDRAPDLAVANSGSFNDPANTVSVLLGNGDGTFQAPQSFVAGTAPQGVVAGDFNRDGILDLATANSGGAAVLLGNGDGTFQPMRSFSAGNAPSAIAVGDFTGDGIPDLAVANYGGFGDVSLLSGVGNGNFLLKQTVRTSTHPYALAVGDFNGDGLQDLAVDNLGMAPYPAADVSVLLGGAGDGTFQPARHVALGGVRYSLAAGDLNGDGIIDLATPGGVLLGNGDATFQTERPFVTSYYSFSVVVGEFNADGKLDLAVTGDHDSVSVLLGKGDGTFLAAPEFATDSYPDSVAVGDFNADGVPDLAVTAFFRDPETSQWIGVISVLLGNGDGTFQPRQAYSAGGFPGAVTIGDFNRDGVPDLAIAITSPGPNGVSVLLGNGDGSFQAAWTLQTGESPGSVVTGDFNRDGALDLAMANTSSGTISVLFGNGDGTFQVDPYSPGVSPTDYISVAAGDFNRDGVTDLAATDYVSNEANGGNVWVLLSHRDGAFTTIQILAVLHPRAVAVEDVNADGFVDLVVLKAGGVSVLMGNGDGTFRESAETFSTSSEAWSLVVADFNGDRRPDVALPGGSGNDVQVLLGNGDGTLQAPVTFRANIDPVSAAVSDFNHDGKTDLVVANNGSHTVSVLINDTVALVHLAVVKDGSGSGSVTSSPAGIDCGSDCSETYASGTVVTLLAAANAGSILAGWSGCDTVSDTTCRVTISEAKSVTATFTLRQFKLTLTKDGTGGGNVASNPVGIDCDPDCSETYLSGSVVTLLADANPGSTFAGWSGCDTASDTTCTVTLSEAKSVTATFILQRFMLTVTKDGTGSGNVASDPAGIDCGSDCSETFGFGPTVTLFAAANGGSTFAGWSGCDTVSDTTCFVTITEAKSVTATFTVQRFALTVTKDGIGSGTVTSTSNPGSSSQINCGTTCSADYDWATVVTLTAAFSSPSVRWRGCDVVSGSTCVVTMGSARSVNATFRESVADSGWFWQNPMPQGNPLSGTAMVDANTIYAVGANGTVLRSIDGGVHWTIQTIDTRAGLYDISCTGANTCIAVGESGTIVRTTDGGVHWSIQTAGTTGLSAVSCSDANTCTAVGGAGTILRTTDGGANWTLQSSPTNEGLADVACTDTNTCTAVGGRGKIVRTINAGATWSIQASGTPTDQFGVSSTFLSGVSCPDANTCTAVGNAVGSPGTIIRTSNGGATWSVQSSGLDSANDQLDDIFCTDANRCTAVGYSVIVGTTNGGATWTRQQVTDTNNIFVGHQIPLLGVSCSDANTCTAVGVAIVRTTDGGVNWTVQTPTSAVTFQYLLGVSCPDANTCTAVGNNGTIVRTADGGATWAAQSSGTTAHLHGVSCSDGNTCTAVGNFRAVDGGAAMILRTTNGGATWTQQASGMIGRLAGVSCPDANTCTVVGGVDDVTSPWGTRATILRTTDGGATWTLQSPSRDPNDAVPELFGVSFTNANTGTAVGAHNTILRTYQGGEDWSPQQPNTQQVVYSVSMTGVDTGMAATDRSILAATPPGTPWTPVSSDSALGISCTDANTCTAVGAGDSLQSTGADILHTTDGGATWTRHRNPSQNVLFSVSCTDADTCTAVGGNGTILRTTTGGR